MTSSLLRWPATMAFAFAMAFLHFALSGGGIAHAQSTVVAIDAGDVTGNTGTGVGTINGCFQVPSGGTYTLDVVVRDVNDLVAGNFTLGFQGTMTDQSVADSLWNHPSPPVAAPATIDPDASGQVPDSGGRHYVVVSNDAAVGSGGATGNGVLVRFAMTAPATPGMVDLTLSDTVLVDSMANEIPNTTQDATLAVDTACAAVTPSPSAAPNPSLTAGASGGPSVSPGASPQTSQTPTARAASPTPPGLASDSGGGGGLPLAAWIGIGLGAAAIIIGGGLLIGNPGLRRRLTGRS